MKARLVLVLVFGGALALFAGPVRPVVSSQFSQMAPVANGPMLDPFASRGQWFVNVTNGLQLANSWEFHDSDDSLSIQGRVIAILWGTAAGGSTNIAGFSILATVSNNPTAGSMLPLLSTNSHLEAESALQPNYQGMMWNAHLAAEFAAAQAGPGGAPWVGAAPYVPGMSPPYFLDPFAGNQYLIEAQNETHAAWYCYSAADPNNPVNPPGAYYVPTWELGDLPPGATAQVTMVFRIKTYNGAAAEMPVTDLRHGVIRYSFMNAGDVLYNRSESLKISHWLDAILIDGGSLIHSPPGPEYEPVEYVSASDVSVFFDSAGPGQVPVLQITPIFNNQALSAVQLSWPVFDVKPMVLQYCDNLASNMWNNVPVSFVPPPLIPGPMGWLDNGSVILPPLQSPRFYRLLIP